MEHAAVLPYQRHVSVRVLLRKRVPNADTKLLPHGINLPTTNMLRHQGLPTIHTGNRQAKRWPGTVGACLVHLVGVNDAIQLPNAFQVSGNRYASKC